MTRTNGDRAGMLAALFGLCGGVALAACAAGGVPREAAAPPAAHGSLDPRQDDIRELWMQIRDWRVELAMDADPVANPTWNVMTTSVDKLRFCPATEADEPGGTCGDVCNLKDAICDNAESICRIAGELDGDEWAADKCKSAKASCKEATDRCCGCAGDAGAADLDAPR